MTGSLVIKLLNIFMARWRDELFPEDMLIIDLYSLGKAKQGCVN